MQKIPLFRAVEVLLGLSILLFVVGNFTFIAGDRQMRREEEKVVLGEETEELSETPTVTPVVEEENVEVKVETKISQEPSPTQKPSENNNSSDFIYPGATSIGGNIYESSDSPEAITDWYKEQIVKRDMNVKTFVTTKTNGNVLNKIAGADGGTNVEIEIEKKEGESKTKITLKQ